MTINLPPRRRLPADVKERMRPDFAQARRNHTPLAVAAGVVLLIAGGVAVTQSITGDPEPGRGRVVSPSSQDVARCRAALGDQTWSSTEMVTFGVHKVLIGEDGRFCELTKSFARVADPGKQPLQLETGTIAYSSGYIVAGTPPLGALKSRSRGVVPNASRGSTDSVTTPDFFVTYSPAMAGVTEMIFDGRTVPVPPGAAVPLSTSTDSFESGDGNKWTAPNLLARCADNALVLGATADELQGWELLLQTGIEQRRGMLLAHRNEREWATCTFSESGEDVGQLYQRHNIPDNPDKAMFLGGYQDGTEFVVVGRTSRAAKTVEVSDRNGGPPVTVDVTHGFFVAKGPGTSTYIPSSPWPQLTITARSANKQIVYTGGFG